MGVKGQGFLIRFLHYATAVLQSVGLRVPATGLRAQSVRVEGRGVQCSGFRV